MGPRFQAWALGMLHPLPFTTFAELLPLGLVGGVYCSRCYETRGIDDERLRDRCFTTASILLHQDPVYWRRLRLPGTAPDPASASASDRWS